MKSLPWRAYQFDTSTQIKWGKYLEVGKMPRTKIYFFLFDVRHLYYSLIKLKFTHYKVIFEDSISNYPITIHIDRKTGYCKGYY